MLLGVSCSLKCPVPSPCVCITKQVPPWNFYSSIFSVLRVKITGCASWNPSTAAEEKGNPQQPPRALGPLTSIRRMSMDSTVVKKNICRKKSDTRPTTAKRQNSCREDTGVNREYFKVRKRETRQKPSKQEEKLVEDVFPDYEAVAGLQAELSASCSKTRPYSL